MASDAVETQTPNHLWQLLWEYDPNGLIVVDADLYIKLVNPAFCRMFKTEADDVIGQPAETILDDVQDFKKVWKTGQLINGKLKEYLHHQLFVSQVIFPIEDEGIIACIMVDFSHELAQRKELTQLKQETVKKVNQVVDNQMKVVQEIAGLLGETTAETKVSLLKIIEMLQHEEANLSVYPSNQPD
ncbi:MAG: PAS domain-containing protein [Leptolyngbya sp. SIO1E4]|nr:PAS domain-containing protein [Leptolyngbya sp. SIO1E4]